MTLRRPRRTDRPSAQALKSPASVGFVLASFLITLIDPTGLLGFVSKRFNPGEGGVFFALRDNKEARYVANLAGLRPFGIRAALRRFVGESYIVNCRAGACSGQGRPKGRPYISPALVSQCIAVPPATPGLRVGHRISMLCGTIIRIYSMIIESQYYKVIIWLTFLNGWPCLQVSGGEDTAATACFFYGWLCYYVRLLYGWFDNRLTSALYRFESGRP